MVNQAFGDRGGVAERSGSPADTAGRGSRAPPEPAAVIIFGILVAAFNQILVALMYSCAPQRFPIGVK
jgi:hypothetical protein